MLHLFLASYRLRVGSGCGRPVTVVSTIPLGGGRAVKAAEGIALDPSTGLVYIGLNGNIISGCSGDSSVRPVLQCPSAAA